MEALLAILGIPLAGAVVLGLIGHQDRASEVNVSFSLATFIASAMLTIKIIADGPILVLHEQFFVDSLNVFLVTLTAFVDAGTNDVRRLFVPFGDLTNGTETYAGGRYLDLDRTATGIYDLDFNRAYHPFCVFNAAYDCPYPPRENRLQTAVRAGEKL